MCNIISYHIIGAVGAEGVGLRAVAALHHVGHHEDA